MSAFSTNGCKLEYGVSVANIRIWGMTEFSDFEGEPEKIPAKRLCDTTKRSIPGSFEEPELTFKCQKGKQGDPTGSTSFYTDEFAALMALNHAEQKWKFTFPDGSGYSWSALPYPRSLGGDSDKVTDYDLGMILTTEMAPFFATQAIGTLVVTSVAAASTVGSTEIHVNPLLTGGNSYVYKTAATVVLPEFDAVCTTGTGYTAWNGTADIVATTGNEIVIVEIGATDKAVKAGKATVTSKA